jgi:GABA(A) receptor-associated protein
MEEKELIPLRQRYPNHVFVLVSPSTRSDLPPLDKHKYIVNKSTRVGEFMYILRKRMSLPPDKAMFLFIDNTLPTSSQTMAELMSIHGSKGYLEIVYAGESTFGI